MMIRTSETSSNADSSISNSFGMMRDFSTGICEPSASYGVASRLQVTVIIAVRTHALQLASQRLTILTEVLIFEIVSFGMKSLCPAH